VRLAVALALGLVQGCAAGAQECGEGQAALDLSGSTGDFLYRDDALPVFTIDMDDTALAGLATSSQDELPDVHATFGFDGAEGAESYDVGLHLKGHSSFHPIDEKAAFKIDFHQWSPDQSFHGVEHLTLNNMTGDPTALSEQVSYRAYGDLGLPAARHSYACVVVNGLDYGLYGVVESMDTAFIERAFANAEGNLYEGAFGADIRTGRTSGYLPQVIRDVEDMSDLAALATAFDAVTPETALDLFGTWFDLDQLLDTWATEIVIGNVDGYLVMTNNYLLYHEPNPAGPGLWTFLPWGMDENFSETVDRDLPAYLDDSENFRGILFQHCLASPDCRGALDEHVVDVAARLEDGDLHGYAKGQLDRIRVVSRHDDMSPASPADTRRAQGQLVRWVGARPRRVANALR